MAEFQSHTQLGEAPGAGNKRPEGDKEGTHVAP